MPGFWFVGYAAIVSARRARPARIARHGRSIIVTRVTGSDEGGCESAMRLFTDAGAPKVASFHDRFVRTDEGWRFSERRGSPIF